MTHSQPFHYEVCGLRIRSEIELHGAAPAPDQESDVVFSAGPPIASADTPPDGVVIASASDGDMWWYVAVENSDGYLLRFAECGDFVVSRDLSRVEVRQAAVGDRVHLVPVLLTGTVMAFLLTLRGNTLMHASAVGIDGRAIAFIGQSGRGKSTIAALMCASGATLVTDDVLVVRADDPPTCVGGAPELRLRPNAASIAHGYDPARSRTTLDERTGFAPTDAQTGEFPLAAIVIPTPDREISEVRIDRLPPHVALFALLSFPRVDDWRRDDELTRDFAVFREIVSSVPLYAVSIPWGPPFDPDVAVALGGLLDDRTEPEVV